MSQPFDKDSTMPLTCSGCGNKIEETIRRLEQNPNITCSHCGAVTKVEADKLRDGFKAVEDALRDAGFRKI